VLIPMLVVGAFWPLTVDTGGFFIGWDFGLLGVFYPRQQAHPQPYQRIAFTSSAPEEDAKGSGYQLLQSRLPWVPAVPGQRVS